MYGWRSRIGILLPTNNTVLEPEFWKMAPDGVTFHTTRMISSKTGHGSVEGLENMTQNNVDRGIEELAITGVDAYVYACLSTSLAVQKWQEKFEEKIARLGIKKPALSAFTAMVRALHHFRARQVSVLCPYGPELTNKVKNAFDAQNIRVEKVESLNVTGLHAVCNVPLSEIYKAARRVDTSGSDALCILATDLPTLPLVAILERDLDKPVVTTNLAIYWGILNMVGVHQSMNGTARLFDQ